MIHALCYRRVLVGIGLLVVLGCNGKTALVPVADAIPEKADNVTVVQPDWGVRSAQSKIDSKSSTLNSTVDGERPSAAASDKPVSSKIEPPIIGQLRGRNHTIIIHTGAGGPRFTVTTPDGRVLAAAMTADEIRSKHPEIYDTYKKTFAQFDNYLDASISTREPTLTSPANFGQ